MQKQLKPIYRAGLDRLVLLEVFLGVHSVPPCRVILQPACEPCHNGVVPADALVVVEYVVVFSIDCDECCLSPEDFQCSEHLYTLVDGHVSVRAAVHEEQRCVHLVGIEERRVSAVELLVVPGVGVCSSCGIVAVAPVSEAPIGSRVANAGMAHGSSEDVSYGLQVHGHEASV